MKYAKLADEDPQWTSGEQRVSTVSAAEGEGLRQMGGAVAECENAYFGVFVLIDWLTCHCFLVSQRGDKTSPNPFLRTFQRTRRKGKRSDWVLYGFVWIREGIRLCLFTLCEI